MNRVFHCLIDLSFIKKTVKYKHNQALYTKIYGKKHLNHIGQDQNQKGRLIYKCSAQLKNQNK